MLSPHAEAARRTIADCDALLARYRAALETGSTPEVVSGWIRAAVAKRAAAEQQFAAAAPKAATSADEVRQMIDELGDLTAALAQADPGSKAQVYADLGVRMVFSPERKRVAVEATPRVCQWLCRRGDLNPHALIGH